jgi:alkanesulfonate monooxygenase SsuD/methylene tetrahydromethanopterin reductase-like flavin-dependent oxidoreductase (luciferase family)
MNVGVIFSQADSGTDPEAIRAWSRRAEEPGFAHIMAYDHILGASVERLGPGPFGPFPAAPYTVEHTFHEVLTLFSHLAAATSAIGFVTSVLVLPQRRIAVGAGWNAAEYEGLETDFDCRRDRLEEQVELLRRLRSEPLVTFDGKFHHLDRVGINPLPARPIPIFLGSGAAARGAPRRGDRREVRAGCDRCAVERHRTRGGSTHDRTGTQGALGGRALALRRLAERAAP